LLIRSGNGEYGDAFFHLQFSINCRYLTIHSRSQSHGATTVGKFAADGVDFGACQ